MIRFTRSYNKIVCISNILHKISRPKSENYSPSTSETLHYRATKRVHKWKRFGDSIHSITFHGQWKGSPTHCPNRESPEFFKTLTSWKMILCCNKFRQSKVEKLIVLLEQLVLLVHQKLCTKKYKVHTYLN